MCVCTRYRYIGPQYILRYVISDSPLLYPEHPKLSLVQMYGMVTESVDTLIQHCAVSTQK